VDGSGRKSVESGRRRAHVDSFGNSRSRERRDNRIMAHKKIRNIVLGNCMLNADAAPSTP
jgi:hypothetical protein